MAEAVDGYTKAGADERFASKFSGGLVPVADFGAVPDGSELAGCFRPRLIE